MPTAAQPLIETLSGDMPDLHIDSARLSTMAKVESKWSRHSTRKAGDGQHQPCFKNCAICQKNMRKALWRFFNGS
jgi:hypothetical protein